MKIFKKQKQNKLSQIKSFSVRAVCLLALFLMIFLVFPSNTVAQTLNERIQGTENALESTQSEKGLLTQEVARFNNDISLIEQDIYKTTLKINELNNKIVKTNKEITEAEKRLLDLRGRLSELIRVMYEEGQLSTIEIIAKSSSFTEFVNRSEYLEQINLRVKDASDEVLALKNKLEIQKKELEKNKNEVSEERNKQVQQRNSVAVARNAKNQLLIQTQGQESLYKKLLKDLYAERAATARGNNQVIGGSGDGGYTFNSVFSYRDNIGPVDKWGFYVYQCTSYAAWHWNLVQRKSWKNGPPGGHAYQWLGLGINQGYTVSSIPRIGAIAVWPQGSLTTSRYTDFYGHVAIVT